MFRIRIDATNLVLVLLAGILTLLSRAQVFPWGLKELALWLALGLFFVTMLRTFFLGRDPERDVHKTWRKEKVSPTKLQQATEQLKLRQAMKLIQSGDKQGGRNILIDIVASSPNSEAAWVWLASVVSPDKRAFCLEKALSINPNNIEAKQHLEKLQVSELDQQT